MTRRYSRLQVNRLVTVYPAGSGTVERRQVGRTAGQTVVERPDIIERPVPGDRQRPIFERSALLIDMIARDPHAEEDLLEQFFGQCIIRNNLRMVE